MAEVAAADLLDNYLRNTVTVQSQGTQQARIPTAVPAQTLFLHRQVLQGVHEALDSALAQDEATKRHASSSGLDGSSVFRHVQSQGPNNSSSKPSTTPRGLFRAMRQADASAVYGEQLLGEHCQPEDSRRMQQIQQEPVFAGTTDALNSEVRLLADHAALTTKLQRLQQDMELRSYRQELLHTLQQPSTLFQQSLDQQHPLQHLRQHMQQAVGRSMPRSSSAVARQHVADNPQKSLLRPVTAPKPSTSGVHCASGVFSTPQTAAAGHSGTGAQGSDCHSLPPQWQQWDGQAAAEYDAAAGGLLASTAPLSLHHLKRLADLELPWRPPASTTNAGQKSSMPCRTSQQPQQRPHTAGPYGNGQNEGMQQRLFIPQQQQQQQGPPAVMRPASAVAALQQSLSELAKLKAKYAQRQQQLQDQQQQQPVATPQQQAQGSQQQQQQQQLRPAAASRVQGTWLRGSADMARTTHNPQPTGIAAGTAHSRTTAAGNSGRARAWADVDTARTDAGAGSGSGVPHGPQQQCCLMANTTAPAAQNYSRWDAWQQQVHGDQQQHNSSSSSAGAQQAAAAASSWRQAVSREQDLHALKRPMSAPRMQRAWDRVGWEPFLPGNCARGCNGSSGAAASCARCSLTRSWGEETWSHHLQQKQQPYRQLQCGPDLRTRPSTAGACCGCAVDSSGSGLRGQLAAFNYRASRGSELPTATAQGRAGPGSRDASLAGWLHTSSTLRRSMQQAGTQPTHTSADVSSRQGARVGTAAAGVGNHTSSRLSTVGAAACAAGGSSWLPGTAAAAWPVLNARLQQQPKGQAVAGSTASCRDPPSGVTGISMPAHLRPAVVRTSGLGPAAGVPAGHRTNSTPVPAAAPGVKWQERQQVLQHSAAAAGAVGPCTAAVLEARSAGATAAARTAAAGGAKHGSAAAGDDSTTRAAAPVGQQVLQQGWTGQHPHHSLLNDDCSSTASDDSRASGWGGADSSAHRELAYAAALARVQAAKQASQQHTRRRNRPSSSRCSDDDDDSSSA